MKGFKYLMLSILALVTAKCCICLHPLVERNLKFGCRNVHLVPAAMRIQLRISASIFDDAGHVVHGNVKLSYGGLDDIAAHVYIWWQLQLVIANWWQIPAAGGNQHPFSRQRHTVHCDANWYLAIAPAGNLYTY